MSKKQPQLEKSPIIAELPMACSDETAAVEFIEKRRWGNCPACVKCGSVAVYKMMDGQDPTKRNKRFLWRCHDCKRQFSVRMGTVLEESRLDLRHWCYALWASCCSKKGVSALQISRQCQISYKSALFLLHRVRHGMASPPGTVEKLTGVCEADETYVGGRPRYRGKHNYGTRPDRKAPVFAVVQRGGKVRARAIASVNTGNLRSALMEFVDPSSRLMTDESLLYRRVGPEFASHEQVMHSAEEYVRGDVHTNTIEGFFSILKRGINGVYHAVSKRHLHRYLAEFEFRYNSRRMNDGDRLALAIQSSEGKRLMYKEPVAPV